MSQRSSRVVSSRIDRAWLNVQRNASRLGIIHRHNRTSLRLRCEVQPGASDKVESPCRSPRRIRSKDDSTRGGDPLGGGLVRWLLTRVSARSGTSGRTSLVRRCQLRLAVGAGVELQAYAPEPNK